MLIEDVDARHVTREQVRRELDALESTADAPGDCLCQHRLADARHVLDQDVSLAQQGHHDELDLAAFSNDHALDIVGRRLDQVTNTA